MNLDDAIDEIEKFFQTHGAQAMNAMKSRSKGKIYELYCLSKTIEKLKNEYNLQFHFPFATVDFMSSPGKIDRNRSHFCFSTQDGTYELHTDIEFLTLGAQLRVSSDRSRYHEADIIVVNDTAKGRPRFDMIALAVECKAQANFTKNIVKQVLGVRREMSLLAHWNPTELARISRPGRGVEACPASEYWLAYTDPRGDCYRHSPQAFGIEFFHWCP